MEQFIKSERIKLIIDWLLQNHQAIDSTDRIRILFNIKGKSVVGEVTVIPEVK